MRSVELLSLLSMLTTEKVYLNHHPRQKSRKIQNVIIQFQDLFIFLKFSNLICIKKINFYEKYTLYSLRKRRKSFLLKLFVLLLIVLKKLSGVIFLKKEIKYFVILYYFLLKENLFKFREIMKYIHAMISNIRN